VDGAAPLVDDKGVITNTIAEGQRLVTRIRILEDGKASNFAPMEQTTTTRAGTGLKQDQKTTSAVLPQARLFAPAVDQIAPGSGRIVEAGSALEIRTTIGSTFGFATDPNAIVTAVTIGGRSIPIRGLNFEQAGAVLRINAELPRDLAGGPQTLMVCVTDLAGLVGCSSVEIVIRPAPTASPSPTATPTPTPPGKGDPPGKPWRVTAPGSRGCRRPAR